MTAEGTPSLTPSNLPPFYPVTVIGGTFDHLHAGHKILLSMAAYITSQKLIIGITGTVQQNLLPFKKVILIKQTTLFSRRKPTHTF
jgi:phosphopantetheine adenylyltransferase